MSIGLWVNVGHKFLCWLPRPCNELPETAGTRELKPRKLEVQLLAEGKSNVINFDSQKLEIGFELPRHQMQLFVKMIKGGPPAQPKVTKDSPTLPAKAR